MISVVLKCKASGTSSGLSLSGESERTSFSSFGSAGGATAATDETQPIDIMEVPMPIEPLLCDAPPEQLDELPEIMPGATKDPSEEAALVHEAAESAPPAAAAPEQPATEVFTESNSEATPNISTEFCVDDL